MLHLDARGVALLGEVPQGLPMPALPVVTREDINEIMPLAMACFVLAAVETTAIGRMFAAKHGYRLDATQEFLAIGSANLLAGPGQRTARERRHVSVAGQRNGRRPNPAFRADRRAHHARRRALLHRSLAQPPQPVLAAVVLMAVTGLIQIEALRNIWRFSRKEFAVAMAALLGVLGAGLLQGVLIGVTISMLLLIGRAMRPRVAEVARIPGTSYFADLARHPENQREPDVLVVRPEGSLIYFNVDHVRDALKALVDQRPSPPRLIVLFMGNVPHVDLAGAELLVDLRATYAKRGIQLRLAETHGEVNAALRRLSHAHAADLAETNQTVDGILSQWRMPERLSTTTVTAVIQPRGSRRDAGSPQGDVWHRRGVQLSSDCLSSP